MRTLTLEDSDISLLKKSVEIRIEQCELYAGMFDEEGNKVILRNIQKLKALHSKLN